MTYVPLYALFMCYALILVYVFVRVGRDIVRGIREGSANMRKEAEHEQAWRKDLLAESEKTVSKK